MTIHDPHLGDANGPLEQRLIEEYLAARGHTRHSLVTLAGSQAGSLLRAASEYASLRLAEMEAKAHYVHEIGGR